MIPGSTNTLLLASAGAAEYQIERSVRFNSADSAYLSRTPSVAGNRKTWTWAGWVKRSGLGTQQYLFSAGIASPNNQVHIGFLPTDKLLTRSVDSSASTSNITCTPVYRDASAWYHIVVAYDTTQATAANRIKIYVNGIEVTQFDTSTYPAQNYDTHFNSTIEHDIGQAAGFSVYYFDGYLADVHFIDGQALDPTSFGEFDTNGIWQPIAYSGTYGTNGFHLPFNDNSTAAALGTDISGNGNTWTVNNISVTAGAGNDSLVDTPTNYGTDTGAGGEVRGNYATLNPLAKGGTHSLSNGNLDFSLSGTSGSTSTFGTIGVSSGKWYWELTVTGTTTYYPGIGVETNPVPSVQSGSNTTGYTYLNTGEKLINSTLTAYGASFTTGDVVSVALDMDAGTLTCYKNGVSQGQLVSGITGAAFPVITGQISGSGSLNFGQRPFAYTAPSGYKALCTQNLPDPTIADGSTAMDVLTWTGSGGNRTFSGLGFSPDLVWSKARSATYNHVLYDSVRGAGASKELSSSQTAVEGGVSSDLYGFLSAFTSDGFTVANGVDGSLSDAYWNGSGTTYAAWTWDAGSSTVTNTDGSITAQVRANPSAGFSVVTWTCPSSGTYTVGHGLSAVPSFVIMKDRQSTTNWIIYHSSVTSASEYLEFSTQPKQTAAGVWGSGPTSTTFSSSANVGVYANKNALAYCFAPVEGYSAFGSYTGNGSADGPFVYTGFRPRWVMIKNTSTTASWWMHDTARNTYNVIDLGLYANTSASEASAGFPYNSIDTLSNGFKIRNNSLAQNGNTNVIIYAAFAENPFKTARAR